MALPLKTIAELETRRLELEELDRIAKTLAFELRLPAQKPMRDIRGRWLPGASGNKAGRPRKKVVRALSARQLRRDFLAALEAPRTVMTPDGPISRPAIDIILESMMTKAAKGHAPLQRFVVKRQEELVTQVLLEDRELASRLERIEEIVAFMAREGARLSPESADMLDKAREKPLLT